MARKDTLYAERCLTYKGYNVILNKDGQMVIERTSFRGVLDYSFYRLKGPTVIRVSEKGDFSDLEKVDFSINDSGRIEVRTPECLYFFVDFLK